MFCQLMHGKDTESISADKDTKGIYQNDYYLSVHVKQTLRISVAETFSQHKSSRMMFNPLTEVQTKKSFVKSNTVKLPVASTSYK